MSTYGRDATPAPARLTHAAAEALISSRLDGPIDPASNRALLAHLATCPACRAFAEQMEAMSRGLRTLPHLPPSPTVSRQVRERLAGGQPWWSRFMMTTGSRVGGMQAAAMMLILLGAVAAVLLVRVLDGDDGRGDPGTITPPSITPATATAQVALSCTGRDRDVDGDSDAVAQRSGHGGADGYADSRADPDAGTDRHGERRANGGADRRADLEPTETEAPEPTANGDRVTGTVRDRDRIPDGDPDGGPDRDSVADSNAASDRGTD